MPPLCQSDQNTPTAQISERFFFAKYTQTRVNGAENKAAFSFLPAHAILWIVSGRDGHRRTKGKSRRTPKKSRDVSGKQRDYLVKAPPAAWVGHAPLHRRTWDRLQGQIQTRGAPRRGISRASRPLRDRAVTFPQTDLSLRSPPLCVLGVEEKTRCI